MTPIVPPTEADRSSSALAQETPPISPVEAQPAVPSGTGMPARTAPLRKNPAVSPPAPPVRPPAARRRGPSGGRWAVSIALAILGGLSWFIFGWGFVASGSNTAMSILVGALPALACLAAGWLLQSWPGMLVTVAAYLAVSAVMWILMAIVNAGDAQAWLVSFPLFAALPAVVMGVTGVAIGKGLVGGRQ